MNTVQTGKILGIGAALVDILIEESDAFVASLGSEKGGMTMVDADFSNSALAKTQAKSQVVPGGSACNTLVGLGRLGAAASFIGRVGNDEKGAFFSEGILASGIDAKLIRSEESTGRVLSVVTPDAQRSMYTFLGAAAQLVPADLEAVNWSEISLIHLEGYLAFNEPMFRAIFAAAKQHNVKVSLDLSSFDVVNFMRPLLEEFIPQVYMLIANEDEAKAYTGVEEEEALKVIAQKVPVAIVKLGARGSLIQENGIVSRASAKMVQALDTTGAGDLWAAGFLYGWQKGFAWQKCAEIGSVVAAEVVQVMGAQISAEGWARIQSEI